MTSVPVKGYEGRATMSWDRQDWDHDMRDTLKRYAALRTAHPALRRGTFDSLYASDATNVYAYVRRSADETLVVVLNNGTEAYPLRVPVNGTLAEGVRLEGLLGDGTCTVREGCVTGAAVSPRSGKVMRVV